MVEKLISFFFQILVWGGISKRGVTPLVIFNGMMDSTFYQGILNGYLIPFINTTFADHHRFQQDNDPKHVSRSTKLFMQERGINWWETPPESPDLNPIENVWHELKYHIRKFVKPSNQEELIAGVSDFWDKLTPERCCRYINHIHKVLPVVVTKWGNASGY